MSPRNKPTSPEGRFGQALDKMVGRPQPRAFVIPTLAADPPEGDPTNLWMRYDGRLRGRYWNGSAFVYVDYPMRSDITAPPAVPAYPAAPALPPAPQSRVGMYAATWSQGYKGDGTKRTDTIGEKFLPFGNDGGVNGLQRSLIGFDYATIASDLAGSTITSVQLTLAIISSYLSNGVDVYFGVHNVTVEPAIWPTASIPASKIASAHFGRPETRTIPLPMEIGTRLRAGTGKGIALESPGSSIDFNGYASGFGSGYQVPVLIITYAK
jgi:hypothetical protein